MFCPLCHEPTVGDDIRTYPLAPEASNAANFVDFSIQNICKRTDFFFFVEDFSGGVGGEAVADLIIGLLGIGGGVVGETKGMGAFVAPIFRFRCISKSPTFNFSSAIFVSSQTSRTNSSNPLGNVALR
ncbi:hypothetical protein LOK49_LG03G02201 [Camellia lanceoleosa]|uniref:Uncharacterized protein n=1 Tax=Camellia lanceoleosa TaxID=1840588 RepID=A0ACC0IHM1_9ERIC|nr:hypothetical protein LOK49_LG03G02201 [Camellia lanceoleosa]